MDKYDAILAAIGTLLVIMAAAGATIGTTGLVATGLPALGLVGYAMFVAAPVDA